MLYNNTVTRRTWEHIAHRFFLYIHPAVTAQNEFRNQLEASHVGLLPITDYECRSVSTSVMQQQFLRILIASIY